MATSLPQPEGRPSRRGAGSSTTRRRLAVLATMVLFAGASPLLGAGPATATTSTEADSAPTVPGCAGLDQMKIPASVMSLPTNGGRVESASVMTSVVSGQMIEYCQVDADIFPVDPS